MKQEEIINEIVKLLKGQSVKDAKKILTQTMEVVQEKSAIT